MGNLKLLDCTLRDGGYINDWRFGEDAIADMRSKLDDTDVDILELGFLKNEPHHPDRTVFNSMDQVKELIGKKRVGTQYAVMVEVVNPLPLEQLAPADEDNADIIRVIIWKTKRTPDGRTVNALQEGFEYCKGVVERGYKLCVQPARVDQYTDEEFVEMVKKFRQLNPMAIYIVDSWGTMYRDKLLHYMNLADENMPEHIAVGYHGHNNMMQAFDVACAFAQESLTLPRDVIIDASVYGIGRGAGNLNLELFAKYLNEIWGRSYHIEPMLEVYDSYIDAIYRVEQWGFSIPYFLTAKYGCNPNYVRYLSMKKRLSCVKMEKILRNLTEDEKIIFSEKALESLI